MKTPVVILLVACALCSSGCSSGIRHVSPEKFKSLYAASPYMASMRTTDYIGHTHNKAYIEDSSMGLVSHSWKSIVYYVYLRELDPAFRDELLNSQKKKSRPAIGQPDPANPAAQIPELFKHKPAESEKQPAVPAPPSAIKY